MDFDKFCCQQGDDGVTLIGTEQSGTLNDAKHKCDDINQCNSFTHNKNTNKFQLLHFSMDHVISKTCHKQENWTTYLVDQSCKSHNI